MVHNDSDAWGWVTVYLEAHSKILTSGCVAPKSDRVFTTYTVHGQYHSVSGVPYDVRIEAEHKDCAHPVMLDRTLGWDGKAEYWLHGRSGKYVFNHTP